MTVLTPVSVRLPQKTRKKLVFLSETSKRSQSSLVTEAVENYIQNYIQLQEWQIEGIKKAIKEMDEGKWIDGDEALKWMHSLGTEKPLPQPSINS